MVLLAASALQFNALCDWPTTPEATVHTVEIPQGGKCTNLIFNIQSTPYFEQNGTGTIGVAVAA